jgi:hypothetical protein
MMTAEFTSGVINLEGLKPAKIIVGPVAILPDGSIEHTPNFTTTDEAAMAFWSAVDRLAPTFLRVRETMREASESHPHHLGVSA